MKDREPQRPVRVIKVRAVRVRIWAHERERNGRKFTSHSARPRNRYFNKDASEWRDTDSYTAADLADLELAVHEARKYMRLELEDPNRPAEPQAADA